MITNEQKINAYKATSPQIKDFLNSDYFNSSLSEIGNEFGLMIDKQGVLGDEVMLVITGLVNSTEFPQRIKSSLGLDESTHAGLLRRINDKIFLRLRDIEQNPSKESPIGVIKTPENSNLNKEDILSEIENPTPAVHPISIADQTLPGPAKPLEITAAPTAKAPTPAQAADAVAKEFIAGKMTEPVSLPTKKYTVDPYREPIA